MEHLNCSDCRSEDSKTLPRNKCLVCYNKDKYEAKETSDNDWDGIGSASLPTSEDHNE